jgi:hypothetical protein
MAGRATMVPRARAALAAAAALWIAAFGFVVSPDVAAQAPGRHETPVSHFESAGTCMACHNGLVTEAGEDVSIGTSWRASMMANSARDPYWHAAVRREVMDHPLAAAAIEDECSKCHMPMARFDAHASGGQGAVFANLPIGAHDAPAARLAAEGVSCTVCHQIQPDNLGEPSSFVGNFAIARTTDPDARPLFGGFEVADGLAAVMRSATGFRPMEGTHIRRSEMCATCHTLITHALDASGAVIGELPEQVPYQEWLHSRYRESASCQDCHMPVVETPTPIASVLGEPRDGFARHEFRGGNFFMLRMLNRYRDELGVEALPQELDAAVRQTVQHLQTDTASISVTRPALEAGRLRFDVDVRNLAGHKFPTAYPSRRAWLHVVVRRANGDVVFESGALSPDGRIAGNAGDEDGTRFEPHYTEITSADQVQIYEAVMAGPDGIVTTGLLTAVRFVKDNRLLPDGFDKATAGPDIAVHGAAAGDADFRAGGDTVRYAVPVPSGGGPLTIEAVLWFQPIGFRWADNLRAYPAPETDRFVGYYDAMAASSGVGIARATAVAP